MRRVQTGPTAFSWAIGVGLAPESRGRGYGFEAQRLLVCYLFAQVNRIEAVTEITNAAGQRALEKAGFTREGVLRGSTFRQGQWHDQLIYSVLRAEVTQEDLAAGDGPAG